MEEVVSFFHLLIQTAHALVVEELELLAAGGAVIEQRAAALDTTQEERASSITPPTASPESSLDSRLGELSHTALHDLQARLEELWHVSVSPEQEVSGAGEGQRKHPRRSGRGTRTSSHWDEDGDHVFVDRVWAVVNKFPRAGFYPGRKSNAVQWLRCPGDGDLPRGDGDLPRDRHQAAFLPPSSQEGCLVAVEDRAGTAIAFLGLALQARVKADWWLQFGGGDHPLAAAKSQELVREEDRMIGTIMRVVGGRSVSKGFGDEV